MKYTYKKEQNKKKQLVTYRCWKEDFKDEGTDEVISIERRKAIKIDGKKIVPPPIKLKNPKPVNCFAAERKEDGIILLDSFCTKEDACKKYIKESKTRYKWKGNFHVIPVIVTVKVKGR